MPTARSTAAARHTRAPRPQKARLPSSRRFALRNWNDGGIPTDLIAWHIEQYAELVARFASPTATEQGREFAYGRLLGVRGQLCRLCPAGATELLPAGDLKEWHRAENILRNFLENSGDDEDLCDVINRVEDAWIASAESYIDALMYRMRDAEVASQLGLLKSIDGVALHLAQREVFRISKSLETPMPTAQEVKLRMRLIALYIMVHASHFENTFPVIRSYRETFRISDPAAYPWWFVDHRLTERELAWTYRRLDSDELAWRF